MQYLIERIKELTSSLFNNLGLILVELKIFRSKGKVVLRFLVDRTEGGISLGECAKLNEQIGQILDKEEIFQEGYILEVSSPGIDRPLVSLEDFSRVIGKDVRLFLREPIKNKTELIGSVDKVEGRNITLLVEGEYIQISIDKVIKAKQIL